MKCLAHFVCHHLADALKVVTEGVAVGLNFYIPQFSHILVDDTVAFCKIDDVHGNIVLAKVVKKRRQPYDCPRFFIICLSYLRPLPEPLRLLLELELLVELPFDELLPLLRVLLLLPTRLLELPLLPLLRVLLLELFTLPLELPLVPLGRPLSLELFTRPLEEPVVPVRPLELLLVFGRVLVPLPVRPLDEPLLSTFGRLLLEPALFPLDEPDEVPLL